jgi:hypothetical protein
VIQVPPRLGGELGLPLQDSRRVSHRALGAPRSRLRLGFQRRVGHLAGVHLRLLGLHPRRGGGFNYHLAETREPTTSAPASCRDIDDLTEDLGGI